MVGETFLKFWFCQTNVELLTMGCIIIPFHGCLVYRTFDLTFKLRGYKSLCSCTILGLHFPQVCSIRFDSSIFFFIFSFFLTYTVLTHNGDRSNLYDFPFHSAKWIKYFSLKITKYALKSYWLGYWHGFGICCWKNQQPRER